MKGAFSSLLGDLPTVQHNDRNHPEKTSRYEVLRRRMDFVAKHAVPFGSASFSDGEQHFAFVVELEEEEGESEMPEGTKVEYVVCSEKPDGSRVTFAYLWFLSIADAKKYALGKGMTVLKGYRGS